MIQAPPASFPTPREAYSRDDESQFRAAVSRELLRLQAVVFGLPINSVFFNVRDYAAPGTTDWLLAFQAADDAAVAADGIVLVPPGTFAISNNVEMLAPIMFAGGIVRPASGKDFKAENSLTALAGEWGDTGAGGTITRPGVANEENGHTFDGTVVLGPNQKLVLDGNAASPSDYLIRSGAGVVDVYAGGLALKITNTLLTILSGADLKLGVAAAAAVAVASTHKLAVKDNTGATYYLLATT